MGHGYLFEPVFIELTQPVFYDIFMVSYGSPIAGIPYRVEWSGSWDEQWSVDWGVNWDAIYI